jgi:hypothetical protein
MCSFAVRKWFNIVVVVVSEGKNERRRFNTALSSVVDDEKEQNNAGDGQLCVLSAQLLLSLQHSRS